MNILILGGAGKVSRLLIPMLARHRVRAVHRRPEQGRELAALGAEPVGADLATLDLAAMRQLMTGCDVVIFSAGAGGAGIELTNAIDGAACKRAVDAARQASVPRFILVSAFPEAGRTKALGEGFENYMAVKKQADAHLAQSDLDWVILRPGTLTLEAGTGKVALGPALTYGSVSREDVAAVLSALVQAPAIRQRIIELTAGEEPVTSAVARLQAEWGK